MRTTSPITAYLITDTAPPQLIQVPTGSKLTPLYELADQDGWTGGKMWMSGGGRVVAIEIEIETMP